MCVDSDLPFSYEKVIALSNESILLLKSTPTTVELKQLFRTDGQITEGAAILFPRQHSSLSALTQLLEYASDKIASLSDHELFAQFFEYSLQAAKTPALPTPPLPSASSKPKQPYTTVPVMPDRLKEGVSGTRFVLEDLVDALQKNQPFSRPVKLPLSQVKVLLYYSFWGKDQMITSDVEKCLLLLNVSYDFKRTGMLLKELASEGLLEMEERMSKNNRMYHLWKFLPVAPFVRGDEL